jgi:O-antigen/teichoic acid export membrane protein
MTALVVLPAGYALVRALGVRGALLTQAVLQGVLLVLLARGWRVHTARVDWRGVGEVVRYGAWIGLANAGYYLYTRIDVFLMGQFGYLAEIAPYELVTRALMLAALPFIVFGQALAPRVASRVATDGAATVLPDIRRHVLVSVGLGFVLAAALYLGFPPLIRAALPDYASPALLISVVLLALLLPSRCWDALLCQGYIVPAGMARILTVTTLAGGLVNVLGDWVALRWFGYAGVIWTTLLVHTAVIWLNHAWFVRACRRARTA